MTQKSQFYYQLERIVRGFSNHRRIHILEMLAREPGLTVNQITQKLRIDFRTASDHIKKLDIAHLVIKRHRSNEVCHKLTARGEYVLKVLKGLL